MNDVRNGAAQKADKIKKICHLICDLTVRRGQICGRYLCIVPRNNPREELAAIIRPAGKALPSPLSLQDLGERCHS